MPCYLHVLGEVADKYVVQWSLAIQKQDLPVGREMITKKASEIHCCMISSMRSIGSVGWGWCDQFMSRLFELTLITSQVIKRARNEASLEGLRSSHCLLLV